MPSFHQICWSEAWNRVHYSGESIWRLSGLAIALSVFLGLFGSVGFAQAGESASRPTLLKPGVVVEWVTKNSVGDKAGVRPGDILLSWTRGDAKGRIGSPFDLPYIKFEQASRGIVTIEGLRGSEKRTWLLASGTWAWGIASRPNFESNLLSTYLEGKELADAGKVTEAVGRWRAAAGHQSDRDWLRAWFLSRAGQVLFTARQWEASDDAYREAIQQAADAEPLIRAELFRQRASGFDYRDDLPDAEKYYEQVMLEWEKMGAETMALSTSLVDLGVVLLNEGDVLKAESRFQQALQTTAKLAPISIQAAIIFANLGITSQHQGDFAKAEEYYRRALAIEDKYFPDSYNQADTITNLGTLAHRRGDFARAQTYYRKALAISDKVNSASLQSAGILDYLGECVLDAGDPQKAEKYLQQALAIREKLAPDSPAVAASLGNLGKVALVRGDLTKATEYYERALAVGEKQGSTPLDVKRFLFGLGSVARQRGDLANAESYFRRALDIMEKLAPKSQDHAEILADLAGVVRQQQKLDRADQLYGQALTELESKTAQLGGIQEDRSRYRALHDRYYREYVELLLAQGQPELAFQVLDGSRSRTLLETLLGSNIDIRQGVDASLLSREREFQRLLNAKSEHRIRMLTGKHTEEQLTKLDDEIAEILYQYQQVQAEMRMRSPKYARLTQPRQLSASEIQQLLDDKTVLLEYSLAETRSLVWVVTNNSLAAYQLPKRAEIERLARQAYVLLNARSSDLTVKGQTEHQIRAKWARVDAEYSKVGSELSRTILGPVATLLEGKRLLVVSDGALQYVPFSALPAPETASPKYAEGALSRTARSRVGVPLVVQHEIVNLPSASILAELRLQRMGRKEAPKAVAVLADPVFDGADERVATASNHARPEKAALALRSGPHASLSLDRLTRSADDVGITRNGQFFLSRLLSTRQEAEAIMAVSPPGKRMEAVDFEASRTMAMNPKLAQYRIVHFATHGLLDSKHPELSGLVLSLVDRRGKPQNGFLELQDIYNLNWPVELVVLSACDTGLGEEINGEGLIGLTRGFMYAGASRVVASLWSVSDEATAELMARFYKSMELKRIRPAAALRAAQIQMWRQNRWRSPYYWAAFQIQGEWK